MRGDPVDPLIRAWDPEAQCMAYHPRSTWKRIYREEEARRRAEKRRFTYFYRVAWAVIGFVTMGVAMWLWKEIR